jgi:phenylalanyl-tRNA synthetase beta chain
MNIKAGEDEFALFELGKSHIKEHIEKESKLPIEFQHLGFVYANKNKIEGAPYFVVRTYLEELLASLGLECKLVELSKDIFGPKHPLCSPFQYGRSAGIEIAGQLRGIIGEFNPEVYKNFKLPESSAGFELDLDLISENFTQDPTYNPLNRFPSISQDLTIESNSKDSYADTAAKLEKDLSKATKASQIAFRVSPVSIFQKADKLIVIQKDCHSSRTQN